MGTRKHGVFCVVLSEDPLDSTRSTFLIHAQTKCLLVLDHVFVFINRLFIYLYFPQPQNLLEKGTVFSPSGTFQLHCRSFRDISTDAFLLSQNENFSMHVTFILPGSTLHFQCQSACGRLGLAQF